METFRRRLPELVLVRAVLAEREAGALLLVLLITKRRLLFGAVVAAAAFFVAGCGGPDRPNVVLIVVDSLRADALGSYGNEPTPSPAIDHLAAEGVRFERAVAPASWNLPSVSSLVTSTQPWVHGQGAPSSGAREVTTLAESFSAAGYRTAAFTEVAWPLLQRGFGTFQNTAFKDTFGSPDANSAARTLQAGGREGPQVGTVRAVDHDVVRIEVADVELIRFAGRQAGGRRGREQQQEYRERREKKLSHVQPIRHANRLLYTGVSSARNAAFFVN